MPDNGTAVRQEFPKRMPMNTCDSLLSYFIAGSNPAVCKRCLHIASGLEKLPLGAQKKERHAQACENVLTKTENEALPPEESRALSRAVREVPCRRADTAHKERSAKRNFRAPRPLRSSPSPRFPYERLLRNLYFYGGLHI